MPVDPLNPTTPSTTGTTGTQSSNGLLGKDDFLKLLIGQMQNQDPMNPTDSSQYVGQMTQFSILEQITNLAQSQSASASNEYDGQAVQLIGKNVTYMDDQGNSASGVVSSVTFTSQGPTLTIGDTSGITPVSVTQVQ